jgi:hypothetical protein
MARFARLALLSAVVLLIPTLARAQGSIAGAVKDSSGAVLPGVTVEAASPVLIEKVRTATTDGRGQYQIVDLRPGAYVVTFTLPGFNTVKREGITLSGSFVATVDVEMRVGALEETITVTGEAPLVDVQSVTRQRAVSAEIIDALPTSRVHSSIATLIPGISATKADIGGTTFSAGFMQGHGSKGDDSRIMTDGISVAAFRGKGAGGQTTPDVGAMQEMTFDYAGASAENPTGGIRVNLIPREGGNSFKGSTFYGFANSSMQSSGLTQEIADRGLKVTDSVKMNYDFNPGFGGPIVRDRLWFYATFRNTVADNYVGGLYFDKNAGDPTKWTFDPDTSRQVFKHQWWRDAQLRLTYQVSPRNKLGISMWSTPTCQCPSGASATTAFEASTVSSNEPWHQMLVNYSAPLTNRILLESTVFARFDEFTTNRNLDEGRNPLLIPVTEQSTGFLYRATPQYTRNQWTGVYYRAALSYVTGTHSLKVGFNNQPGALVDGRLADNPLSYRVNRPISQGGTPNQLTLRATPFYPIYNVTRDLGIYVQDKWTLSRLTLSYGLRYDNFRAAYPEQHFGPVTLAPKRDVSFPETAGQNWKDWSPKSAVSYDVFGNQRTAIKASLNRYVAGNGSGGLTDTLNPFTGLVSSTTRTWTDSNNNFFPDCDILNPVVQDLRASGGDFCAAMSNSNFGTSVNTGVTVDPKLKNGWFKREFNWEFSTGVQHQLTQGVALDVSYFRRWYGNFQVTDDRNLSASDFDKFLIPAPTTTPFATTAPAGTQLPNGGNYNVENLYNIVGAKFGQPTDNFVTLSDTYGKQTEHWNGFDVLVSARLHSRLTIQGGTSTGRTTTNSCEIRAKLPETALLNPYCETSTGFLTDLKGFVTYTVPRAEVLLSTTFQSSMGPQIQANYVATNAVVQPSLGRALSGNAPNVTVPLIKPGEMFGDHLYQLDFRIGKVFRFNRYRFVANLDVFNALNQHTVLTENSNFDVWRRPTSILMARFAKVGFQLDF